MMKFAFSPKTKAEGWGTMDPAVWQEQIDPMPSSANSRSARPSSTR